MFTEKQAEGAARVRAALEPALIAGEQLLGAMYAPRKAAFSPKMFAIGTTDQRLILVEIDRKFAAKGAPISVRRADITRASIDGWGGGVKQFLASAGGSAPEIRFETADEKYRFLVTGGVTGNALMGADYMNGLDAACDFIWSATH